MGGLSGILGHLKIADDVLIGAHTLITKSINKSGNYVGIMPAQNQKIGLNLPSLLSRGNLNEL